VIDTFGVYTEKGTPSSPNGPGARYGAVSWIDAAGNLWLFGGYGNVGSGGSPYLNDLWKYTPSAQTWTWVSGSAGGSTGTAGAPGVYGTKGTASVNNVPGARDDAVSWTDATGNLWLFGGNGYDSTDTLGWLNDLWKYSPIAGTWTWVSGSDVAGAFPAYGTQGTASTSNVPGARYGAVSWIDTAGNLWLLGGYGFNGPPPVGPISNTVDLDDLWEYNPTAGTWTWVSGAGAAYSAPIQGVPSSTTYPPPRDGAISWLDSTDNFWLFGGQNSNLGPPWLDDFWGYKPSP
jgi:N-acetylneuraminic acid mutarotase